MEKLDILIIGAGGREHALGWGISHSTKSDRLFFVPGNAGTLTLPNSQNLNIEPTNIPALLDACMRLKPGLIVIGPEVPLALGMADKLREAGFRVFGPSAAGARLEASKIWAKEFMAKYKIPTAKVNIFVEAEEAKNYVRGQPGPFVVKADGLAAGKGVLVTDREEEALIFIEEIMQDKIFGEAGSRVIIEEFLKGIEVSALAFCDTESGSIQPLEPACDYKRAFDGDNGPNTGGMGAYSPPVLMDYKLRERVQSEIFEPTLDGLKNENIDYRGIVYAGLILTSSGPKVLEYNCRFGDPETQSLIPRLKSDLLSWLEAVADGKLKNFGSLEWDERPSVGVVLAAPGYPGPYQIGLPVSGVENLTGKYPDVYLFHAGTELASNGTVVTSGGRVFNLVVVNNFANARFKLYNILQQNEIGFEGMHYRRDIAEREVQEKF